MSYLIKGYLPWKSKNGEDLFAGCARSRVKKDLKEYMEDLDIEFVNIYK